MINLILLIFENIVFYFVIFVVKYRYYPTIITDYFSNYQILSQISLQNQIIIFSFILGIFHFLIYEIVIKKIVTKSNQINYMRIFITPALFYGIKLFNISRILLGLTIIVWVFFEFFLHSKIKIYVPILCIVLLIAIIQINIFSQSELNSSPVINEQTTTTLRPPPPDHLTSQYIQNCLNTFSTSDKSSFSKSKLLNNFYIVGHAYGAHNSTNKGLQNSLLEYFENQNLDKASLFLTGDIVKESSFENLNLAKNQIERYFDKYYISIGNHDIGHGTSTDFYKIFKEDLHMINYENLSIVVANFSTYNWQPTLKDKVKINNFIKKTQNKNVIILSHPVFWYNLTLNKPIRNGDDMLKVELGLDTLDWLEQNDKNITFISGDYGSNVPETFCEYDPQKNILYIASGVYDQIEDRLIVITEISDGFYLEEKLLNN